MGFPTFSPSALSFSRKFRVWLIHSIQLSMYYISQNKIQLMGELVGFRERERAVVNYSGLLFLFSFPNIVCTLVVNS